MFHMTFNNQSGWKLLKACRKFIFSEYLYTLHVCFDKFFFFLFFFEFDKFCLCEEEEKKGGGERRRKSDEQY